MHRLPVGGLRLHSELTLLQVHDLSDWAPSLTDYLALLDQRGINISFLVLGLGAGRVWATWCVASHEGERATDAALRFPRLASLITSISPVCALSVFPHQGSLLPLQRMLHALRLASVPVLALGTSVSLVTCVVAEARVSEGLSAVEEVFALPENHAPIRLHLRHEPILRGEEP